MEIDLEHIYLIETIRLQLYIYNKYHEHFLNINRKLVRANRKHSLITSEWFRPSANILQIQRGINPLMGRKIAEELVNITLKIVDCVCRQK